MDQRFNLSVCPHDTAKHMVEWFQLNTYLQRKLNCGIHFEPQDNFLIERQAVLDGGFQIVYANPFSALLFIQERGYIPVAKAADLYDETVLVSLAGAGGIPARRPLRIASATDKLIVHTLGLHLLEQQHIPREECEFLFVGNHMKAAQAVLKGEAELGFVFNETWHGMGEATRQQMDIVTESTERLAFHCFCIAPEWAERRVEIQQILAEMGSDSKGRLILGALHFKSLEPLSEDALVSLQGLHAAYEGG